MDKGKIIDLLKAKQEGGEGLLVLGVAMMVFSIFLAAFADDLARSIGNGFYSMNLHPNSGGFAEFMKMMPGMLLSAAIVTAGGYWFALKYVGWALLLVMTSALLEPFGIDVSVPTLVIGWITTITATVLTSETYMGSIYMRP